MHQEPDDSWKKLGLWPPSKSLIIGMNHVQVFRMISLLREILGNPFRTVTVDPAWLTPTVRSLAEAAYDERRLPSGELDLARLAVLSDALEEGGCTSGNILSHLRSPDPHVRGCWALDLVMGKE